MHIQRTNILAPAIAALAIAAFLLMQDRQGTVYPEALLRADSIVSKQPDSAAVILDGLEHGMASAPEAVRMRYRLIRQKQIAYSFGSFTSDSAARALVEYYETRGERSRLPEAYYYAGKTYMSLNDSPMAMEYFFKTLDAAAESDLNLRGRTYSQLGYIFDRQWLDSEALGMFKKAYRCSNKTNDTVSMIFSLRDMGGMYVDLSKPDSALACYNKALALAEASHDKPMAITVTGQLARFYSQQGDYEMAFKCLNKVIGEDSCWDRGSIAGIAAKWYEANGKPASFEADSSKDDTYTLGALGVMSSYNRIGAVAPSANRGVMVQIMRDEWDFNGYNVTDFTGVSLKAAPKESILAGTTAFCGFGVGEEITYWNAEALSGDADMMAAIRQNCHYLLYALANSAAMNGVNSTTRTVDVNTWWRMTYKTCTVVFAAATVLCLAGYVVSKTRKTDKRGN